MKLAPGSDTGKQQLPKPARIGYVTPPGLPFQIHQGNKSVGPRLKDAGVDSVIGHDFSSSQ